MRRLWGRVYFLFNQRRLDRDLAEEMEAHREMMPPERSSHFGNATWLREESRDAWVYRWLEQLWQDLAYAARVLRRAPGFTLGAVTVLALGVGVNLAEFQIFDAMIFHRLNFRDASVALQFTHVSNQGERLGFPAGAVELYRSQSTSYAWLIAEDTTFDVVVEGDVGLRSNLVSANYFTALGIVPAAGRLLNARDAKPGAPLAAVLGYDYWQTHWAGDPQVVGRVVRINNRPVEIVGALPYSFEGLMARRTAVWLVATVRTQVMAGATAIEQDYSRASEALYGKLKPGVSRAAGEAELTALTRELVQRQPRAFRSDEIIHAHPVQEPMSVAIVRSPAIAVFIVMVLLVLLSACANLGNMLLARGLARQREIDIRAAIGASRGRVVRQLMTENVLLAILGGAAGVPVGGLSARVLMLALGAPPGFRVHVTWPILAAGFVLSLLSAVAFGLPSALQTVHPSRRKAPLRQGLVGIQVAVSCLLLIAAGVLAHNGILAASTNLAFDYRNMAVIAPQFFGHNLTPAVAQLRLEALSSRLSALPGVDGVTLAVIPPLGGRARTDTQPGLPHIYLNPVAASYFGVMNLPLVRGRTFLPGEVSAVIVNESAARAVWPNQDPVGQIWKVAGAKRTVVGVVRDSGANLLAEVDSIEAYLPIDRTDLDRTSLILHTRADPGVVARMIPGAASAAGETVGVSLMRTSRDNALLSQQRLVTLIASIGAVASALAAAGMFALIAFAVAQRKRELGIRIAIGATSHHILAVLLAQNVRPWALGAVAGSILAAVLSRLVRSMVMLQNRDTVDIVGFAAGLACFVLIAALATLSPAIRALRIDPSTTLREE